MYLCVLFQGLSELQDISPVCFGHFNYKKEGPALQTFATQVWIILYIDYIILSSKKSIKLSVLYIFLNNLISLPTN